MTEKAQKIWETYINGYSELLCTPVENFDNSLDEGIKKIIASVLRAAVQSVYPDELEQSLTTFIAWKRELLEIADELETLGKLSQGYRRKDLDAV